MADPTLHSEKRDIVDPKFNNPLNDIALLNLMQSSTDKDDPSRANPNTESEDPSRITLRTERALPKLQLSMRDREHPKFVKP